MTSAGSTSASPVYYYSTQPYLAWVFNHFFYGRRHFSYLAAPFHPYRMRNPASSNPWKQYRAQYEPWVDDDEYDSHVLQKRVNIRNGVAAQGWLPNSAKTWLNYLCAHVDQRFLMPIVYRVDMSRIDPLRRTVAGSGSVGSNEVLVRDLQEHEFDVLFFDPLSDPNFADPDLFDLGTFLVSGRDSVDLVGAIDVLARRSSP